eukprot:2348233-Rhodomonas_salina.1
MALSYYVRAMRCPVLIAYVPILLHACYAMPGADLAYGTILLHACYAMSGTDLACGPILLHACYAMSGTHSVWLRACYAMPGTDVGYVLGARCTRSSCRTANSLSQCPSACSPP